jgi:hypothetical protein
MLGHLKPDHTFKSYLYNIHFNIYYPQTYKVFSSGRISECILWKQGGRVGTGCNWLRIGTSGGLL